MALSHCNVVTEYNYHCSNICRIFEVLILIIIGNTQYSRCWSILLMLSTTQYFRGMDTAYIKEYAVFSGVDTPYI